MRESLAVAACVGVSASLAVLVLSLCRPSGPLATGLRRYQRYLDRQLSFLFASVSAQSLALGHVTGLLLYLALVACFASLPGLFLAPVWMALPAFVLERRCQKKRDALSAQLAPWLSLLAHQLETSSNIAEALRQSASLCTSPLREELELIGKELHLGEHIDRALQHSSERIQTPLYASIMTALLVARSAGGQVQHILAESASVVREMERLAGVLRSKTAEGKSQVFVLALLPFVMAAALQRVDPGLLPGLLATSRGVVVLAISVGLWLVSVVLARRIVEVDL